MPTVYDVINNNLEKIEELLQEQEIKETKKEKEIIEYIANIICIDTLEPKMGYHSSIISALIESNKTDIIELAKSKSASNEIPFQILNSNDKIELYLQNKAFKCLKELHKQNRNITLPSQIRYQICLDVLKTLYKLYGWSGSNTKLNNVNTLSYFAMLMCKWVNNESLSQIISESIEYYHVQHRKISLNHKLIDFDRQNKIHVNELIGNIIEDIEEILRFQLEKYFNHYHMMVKNILGEENAGENWAMLLEYGTQNREIIALQNMGPSRYSAQKIFKECRGAFISENGQLKKVDKSKILSKLQKGSIEYIKAQRLL